ncbi:MAG: CHAP domain-containing protein [Pseudomonadota bacterium]
MTAELFAEKVHDWQGKQVPSLTADGKLGPKSWARLQADLERNVPMTQLGTIPPWLGGPAVGGTSGAGGGDPIIEEPDMIGTGPAWLRVARFQMRGWQNAGHGEADTDWDEAYFLAAPRWGNVTHTLGRERDLERWKDGHWCAAFVNWCLHTAGFSHTGSAGAHSFTKPAYWEFDALREPRVGCIIVTASPGSDRGGHVAFLDDWNDLPESPAGRVTRQRRDHPNRWYSLLGGNQGSAGTVNSRRQDPWKDMLAARGRNGVTSPYFWPAETSAGTCTISSILPTRTPHACHYAPEAE